ncbi:MAG: hypothetical protein H7Z74_07765 [Anaerolineae bacterium]|nr:hypothetical protein [Gemmatimonadaceae bacterium]
MNARAMVRTFFLAPSAPTNLAVCRIIFYGGLFCFFFSYDVAQWAYWPADSWTPVWFIELFGPLPSARTLSVLGVVWKVSLVMGALGFFREVSFGIAAVLGAYVLGLTGSFVKHNYDIGLPVILLFVFWVARSTDAISLDALLARRRLLPPPAPSGEYTWPLALTRVLLALAFFTAGSAKLGHSGVAWITTDNLRWLFMAQQYTHTPPLNWAASIAEFPWLCRLLAGGTVALELGYPLALFVRRLRPWLVLGVIALQLGIQLLMGINYMAFLLANVVWVDWAALGRMLRGKLRQRPELNAITN